MAKRVRFDRRMSDHEALMWALEDDPVLRSAFANVTITDRPLDVERLRVRMATTVQRIPRLRQRVVSMGTLACPHCDAPVSPGGRGLSPGEPIACPFCGQAGYVRDFLSLASPTRHAHVEIVIRRTADRDDG